MGVDWVSIALSVTGVVGLELGVATSVLGLSLGSDDGSCNLFEELFVGRGGHERAGGGARASGGRGSCVSELASLAIAGGRGVCDVFLPKKVTLLLALSSSGPS
jgi:hypothetical protein